MFLKGIHDLNSKQIVHISDHTRYNKRNDVKQGLFSQVVSDHGSTSKPFNNQVHSTIVYIFQAMCPILLHAPVIQINQYCIQFKRHVFL